MTIRERINSILAKLKLDAKAKSGLTADETAQVVAEYKAQFNTELSDDLKKMKEDEEKLQAFAQISGVLKTLSVDENADGDDNAPADPNKEVVEGVQSLIKSMKELQAENAKLASQAREDKPEAEFKPSRGLALTTTSKHLFGIEHKMFSMDKRWNRISARGRSVILSGDPSAEDYRDFQAEVRSYGSQLAARMSSLHEEGHLNVTSLVTEGTVDYSALRNISLGDEYIVRRMDALIAQIIQLPGLTDIFPMRSNIQDGEILTSAFFGEFSQGYQAGEVSKGSLKFQPEKAKVHDVMFKYLIESFKWIETSYLGYLNTSGSHPVKWNMIEWLVLEIAKVLKNEQNKRLILGCRVEPVSGKVSPYLFGATGLVYKLLEYVESFKLLPFDDDSLNTYTQNTIGDVMDALAAEVANTTDLDLTQLAIYVNLKHKPWYLAWYRAKYGKDIDFNGPELKLMNYEMPIKFVPNMGNSCLMFITKPGNIQTLENKPGEMNSVNFEQHLESVWAWSVWKEGVSATFVGQEFKTLAELKANKRSDQVIFMNYPVTDVAADATTVDGKVDFLFRTGANTKATALTDITNARTGVVYKIECGDATNATTIAKSGKFASLKEGWTPAAAGDWIKVYFDGTNFQEVARS